MNGIDPKSIFWFGVWTNILTLIAGYGVEHAPSVVVQYAPTVQWLAALGAQANSIILTALVGASSTKAGPFIKIPDGFTPTIVKLLLIAFLPLALLANSGSANAAEQRKLNLPIDPLHLNGTPVTGDVSTDMQALWQKIVSSSITDLNYAAAMAASANTTTSGVRLQCLKAIIQLNQQASGANLKNPDGSPMVKPDPHLFTDVEGLAEVVDNLSPQGPLFVSCAGAAQLAKTNVLSFVNAVVTGAAGFAAMPIIPGL